MRLSRAYATLFVPCAFLACSRNEAPVAPAKPEKLAESAKVAPPGTPRFTNVLAQSGITFKHHFIDSESGSTYRINPYDHGSAVLVADANGDGLEDVLLLDFMGPNHLYLNRGGLRFENVAGAAGVEVDRAIKVGGAFGDYDNDGDQDLYVTTYRGGNHLFRNRGDATFEDVTKAAGVEYVGHTASATWFDYDLDGDLDLYLGNIGKFTTDTISQEANYFYEGVSLPFKQVAEQPDALNAGEPNILFKNNGNGTFTDATKQARIGAAEWNGDSTVADIDLDGDLDLFASNMFGANHLYRNKGDGSFEDVTATSLGRTSWGGMGCRFFDANGDAYPDLLVVDMHSDMWTAPDLPEGFRPNVKWNNPLGSQVPFGRIIEKPDDVRARAVTFGNTFFVNKGDGTFIEKSEQAGLETWWPWGEAVGDFNNDGREDLFIPAGMGFPFGYWPNSLMLNLGGTFVDVAKEAGIEPPAAGENIAGAEIKGRRFPRSSRAGAIADFDRDGDLDIVVANFNHEPYLFRNDSPVASSLRLKLRGKSSNRDAMGARVVVAAKGRTWTRHVTNAEGYLTQSSPIVHLGLGTASVVDSVEIFWPGQKAPQKISSPAIGKVVEVVQP